MQDDSKINVEKIGSGNWYWSFASEDKKQRQKALEDAQNAHDKASSASQELRDKLTATRAQHDLEEEMLDSGAESRDELTATKVELEKVANELQKQLATYADTDPAEYERKKAEIQRSRKEADEYTDEIYSMEGWFKNMTSDESVKLLRAQFYGDELDEEDGVLKDLT